jgi:hypothetical protein
MRIIMFSIKYTTDDRKLSYLWSVMRIWIWMRMFLGVPDPDPLARVMDPDPAQDPSVIGQK